MIHTVFIFGTEWLCMVHIYFWDRVAEYDAFLIFWDSVSCMYVYLLCSPSLLSVAAVQCTCILEIDAG